MSKYVFVSVRAYPRCFTKSIRCSKRIQFLRRKSAPWKFLAIHLSSLSRYISRIAPLEGPRPALFSIETSSRLGKLINGVPRFVNTRSKLMQLILIRFSSEEEGPPEETEVRIGAIPAARWHHVLVRRGDKVPLNPRPIPGRISPSIPLHDLSVKQGMKFNNYNTTFRYHTSTSLKMSHLLFQITLNTSNN